MEQPDSYVDSVRSSRCAERRLRVARVTARESKQDLALQRTAVLKPGPPSWGQQLGQGGTWARLSPARGPGGAAGGAAWPSPATAARFQSGGAASRQAEAAATAPGIPTFPRPVWPEIAASVRGCPGSRPRTPAPSVRLSPATRAQHGGGHRAGGSGGPHARPLSSLQSKKHELKDLRTPSELRWSVCP